MTSQPSRPQRVAVISVHTSPLAQPGTGDAGGMNVYVLQTAIQLARRGIEVEIFTRATSSSDPAVQQAAPGVLVRNIAAGPFEGLDKHEHGVVAYPEYVLDNPAPVAVITGATAKAPGLASPQTV